MAGSDQAFQRARSPEHKEQRRNALLSAARELALLDGVRSVTLTAIAQEAGIRKSGVQRYFETREEIYLHLTATGWCDWANAMRTALGPPKDSTLRDVAAALADTLAELPLFCELLSHASLNLERHVSADSVRTFKLTALGALDELAGLLRQALPGLDAVAARDLVAAATAIAATLWQAAHPPESLAGLYETEPALAHAVVDFSPSLHRMILTYLTGLVDQAAPTLADVTPTASTSG